MDDATQKDYVPQRVEVRAAESWMDRPIKVSLVTDALRGTNANTFYLDESEARALAAALEAAQRPPVSPEVDRLRARVRELEAQRADVLAEVEALEHSDWLRDTIAGDRLRAALTDGTRSDTERSTT